MGLRILVLVVVFAACGTRVVSGQTAEAERAGFAQEAAVIERLTRSIVFEEDGSHTEDSEVQMRIQSAGALQQLGTIAVPYSREFDTLEFRSVRVLKSDGSIVDTPVESPLEVPAEVTRDAPAYSDIFLKHINVRGLSVGDSLSYAVRIHRRSPLPGEFWFEHTWSRDLIVLAAHLRVSLPISAGATVKSIDPQPAIQETAGRRIYTWRYTNLARPDETAAAVEAYANRERRAAIQISSFDDWAAVGDSIRALWQGRADVTPAIRDKARELTDGSRDDVERLQALHTFVSTNIRYVAVSLGIGRLQPHAAGDVLTNGFGDCKDKHVLLVALLRSVGIDAETVLIGPGSPMDPDVPSPLQFDHVITYVPGVNGGTWLDTTLEVAAVGQLASTERDRQVLLIPAAGRARITRTPDTPSSSNVWTTDVTGKLDENGTLTATVRETYVGDPALITRRAFRAVPPAQWPELASQIWIVSKFGGTVTNIQASSPEDTRSPFQVTYEFRKEKYSSWDDHEVQAPFPATLPALPEGRDPVVPVSFGSANIVRSTARIELPAGFEPGLRAGSAPHLYVEAPAFTYEVHNKLTGRVFESGREVNLRVKELPLAQFAEYRVRSESIGGSPFTVVLTELKPWAWGDPATIDWFGGTRSSTLETMRTAVRASDKKDYPEAVRLLEQLARSEPETAAVGVLLGWVQIQSGALDAGLSTLRAQVARTPTPSGFKRLAISLRNAGRQEEALAVWREAYAAFPHDRQVPVLFGEELVATERFGEAVPVLQSQVDAQRGSSRFFWNLGSALLGDGSTDAALSAYEQALAAESTPHLLNRVAWSLAEARVGLAPAVEYAQRAVRETEEVTARFELSGLDTGMLGTMGSLAAYWDTLAWAHFGLGQLDVAERYMRPAWELSQQGIFAAHLGEILEASGDRSGATDFFALALAADPPEGSAADRLQALLPDETARAAAISNARATIESRRTVTVPAIPTIAGRAVVFLRVRPDGSVDDVRFVSGDATMRAAAEMIRSVALPAAAPSGSVARVIRRGVLTCQAGASTCDLVLTPAAQVTAVD